MANSILTPSMITRYALRMFLNTNYFVQSVNRQFEDQFGIEGARIGAQLRIRYPNQYTTTDGPGLSIQDTTVGGSSCWNGATFTAACPNYVAATGTTSWSYALAAGALTNTHNYTATVETIDNVTNTNTAATTAHILPKRPVGLSTGDNRRRKVMIQ